MSAPVNLRVSNRTLVRWMQANGWKRGNSDGNWLTMSRKHIVHGGTIRMKVRPENTHEGTPNETIMRILEASGATPQDMSNARALSEALENIQQAKAEARESVGLEPQDVAPQSPMEDYELRDAERWAVEDALAEADRERELGNSDEQVEEDLLGQAVEANLDTDAVRESPYRVTYEVAEGTTLDKATTLQVKDVELTDGKLRVIVEARPEEGEVVEGRKRVRRGKHILRFMRDRAIKGQWLVKSKEVAAFFQWDERRTTSYMNNMVGRGELNRVAQASFSLPDRVAGRLIKGKEEKQVDDDELQRRRAHAALTGDLVETMRLEGQPEMTEEFIRNDLFGGVPTAGESLQLRSAPADPKDYLPPVPEGMISNEQATYAEQSPHGEVLEVLELLFPHGIKPRYYVEIGEWVERTTRLVEAARVDG